MTMSSTWTPKRSCVACVVQIPANRYACETHWALLPPDIKRGVVDTWFLKAFEEKRVLAQKVAREFFYWGRPTS